MSNVSSSEIKREFVRSKIGLIGIGILASLVILSVLAAITIPIDTFKQWNNPGSWLSYPKTAVPVWVNYFMSEKIPEHLILDKPAIITKEDIISLASHQFGIQYHYDDFPSDFIYEFNVEYSGSQLLQISVIRPDQSQILLLSRSLPYSDTKVVHHELIFSTDNSINKNIQIHFSKMGFYYQNISSENMIFASIDGKVLKGDYLFLVNIYGVDEQINIIDSKLILGGKAYGMMGTDELRRDLVVGLLWGTPLALFIGVSVAVGSVISGLIYGVYSGFKGKKNR